MTSELSLKDLPAVFFDSLLHRFAQIRDNGEGAMAQLKDEDLYWSSHEETNSIAIIVKHLHGNMMSRWTDFLTTDGEKSWRERDDEFEGGGDLSRAELLQRWEEGWGCLNTTLQGLTAEDLCKDITIRGKSHSVTDALLRQLAHYALHIGEIINIARHLRGPEWKSLSIPRGQSSQYTPGKKD
jgi:hypothetical protein